MTDSYIKFNVSDDVVSRTYEALQISKESGRIKKGINEVTKSVERGIATFVVMAEDITPIEIAMHLPQLCEQKNIQYSYVKSKLELGKAIGMNVPCAAVAVENQGNAKDMIKEIISKITGKSSAPQKEAKPKEEPKPEPKPEPAAAEQPKEEPAEEPKPEPSVEEKPAEAQPEPSESEAETES